MEELCCIVKGFAHTIHILLLTETWIKSNSEAQRLSIPNYTHYYSYRHDSRGGGVSIYAHNGLKHNQIDELYADGNNFLWINLPQFSLDVGVVYKPGDTNHTKFLDSYSTQLEKRTKAIVFGDFNLDLLSTTNQVSNYRGVILENGYTIMNKEDEGYCTRETSSTKTILDHVCLNINDKTFHLAVIDSSMSDHKQIYFEAKKYKPSSNSKMQYEAIEYTKLYKTMQEIRSNSQPIHYEHLDNLLKECIQKSKIVKTKILNLPQKDWINKDVIQGINTRNDLFRQYKMNPKDENIKINFTTNRNKLAEYIQTCKSEYYINAFNQCVNKPLKMWNLINTLSKNKMKNSCAPSKIKTELGIMTNEKSICEAFNLFFSSIGSKLAAQITASPGTPTSIFNNFSSLSNNNQLSILEPCTKNEVLKIINNLNSNTSAGIDGINTKSIKCLKDLIVDDIVICINYSLENGTFPDNLKVAKVSPIYKSGCKTDPGNYRPISVLPVVSKIYEKVIYNRLDSYLTSVNFLFDRQYGFRPKSNTLSATIDLVTKIKTSIDQKQLALGVFIDLKKAFDTVSHYILLQKLQAIGVTGNAHKIFASYLSSRSQIVKIGNSESSSQLITCGVPQGSILGPLLFLIYINSISDIGLNGHLTLYADDTCLFYFGTSIHDIIRSAQLDLHKLNVWFQSNLLTINISKTSYIIFATPQKKIEIHQPLNINGQILQKTTSEKYLGLILDSGLTWKPHIMSLKSKLQSLMGLLRSFAKCLPRKVKYLIYNSLVKPHLDYLIEIWGCAAKTNLNIIQIAQNKLIKILFHYDFLESTEKIYNETKFLTIKQIYISSTCTLIRKIINKEIHSEIVFSKNIEIYQLNTRSAHNIHLPRHRTNYGKKTILYEGAQLYNKLPKTIKDATSLQSFKQLLKLHILNDKLTLL